MASITKCVMVFTLAFLLGTAIAYGDENAEGTVNGRTEGSQQDADPAAEPPSDDPPPAAPEDDGGVAAAAAPPGGGGGGPEEYSSQLGYENLNKLKLTSDVTAETTALLGETIDLNTGAISFEQIDVLLPGNSELEVAIRRTFKGKSAFAWLDVHPFENWLLDIPYIHTNQVYSTSAPSTLSGPWGFGRECAMDMTSGIATFQGNSYTQDMWWTGDTLHVPGKVHDKLLMNNGTAVITSGSYPKVTASNWRVSCIDRFENGVKVGEGFVVESPGGLTYTFSKLKRVQTTWADILPRYDTYMLVTKVEDRFGNYVNYNYSGTKLISIIANDGRTITLQYGNSAKPHRITSVTANGRVWSYGYSADYLHTVTRPDGKGWTYGINYMSFTSLPQTDRFCNAFGGNTATISVEHPNGATGTFTMTPTRHGRTNVPERIYLQLGERLNSKCFWTFAVTKKKLEGPGLATLEWNYSYSQNWGTWSGQASGFTNVDLSYPQGLPATASARNSKTTTVIAPDGSKTVHFFNRDYSSALEGKETAVDQYDTDATTLLSRMEMTYQQQGNRLGFTRIDDDNVLPNEYRVNLTKQEQYLYTTGGAEKYTKVYSQFDVHGVPSKVREYNTFSANQRYTLSGYRDGTSAWILNQPTTVGVSAADSGYVTVSQTTYDTSDRPYEQRRFGRWARRFSYHPDGNVKRITHNATNRWIEFSNYKRGSAQTIMTPQSLSTSPQYAYVTVDNNGWITQTKDFLGTIVSYDYDDMGRLSLVNPADPAWANTVITYSTTIGSESLSHVVAGMFKKTVSKGNYRQIAYHDALLRPNLTREYDNGAVTATSRFARTEYNTYGNPVFESLADGTSATSKGVVKTYDGLQRIIDVDDNTNTGSISTSYLYGNKIRISDNKGNVTTTTYLAYGEPSADAPTLIAQPVGVTTSLSYNLFGNMTSASQGGITQHNVYDGYQNLCKIVRPDSGNEALQLDAIGQMASSGKGTSVDGSTSSCDTTVTSTAKVTYTYDNLGNIRLVNYGDASPDKTYTYDKNSQLLSLAAGGVSTIYTYNSAGLPTGETLVAGGNSFGVSYGYDSLGHLASLTYPSAANVASLPNALGQATKAGSYASLIAYHPNGATKSLTYGNGRVYTMTQNARTLPEYLKVMSGSTTVSHLRYQQDANANITSITDYVISAANRSMTYDGLDRLKTASGLWGSGSYSYDVLGNIKTKIEGGQTMTYNYNTSLNRLTSITGTNARSFTYDDYGNVTGNGLQGFTYNLAGQMVSSTLPNIAYQYDGNDRRVLRTEGGQTTYSLYSQAGQLLHKNVGGVATDYIYAAGMLIAEKQGSTTSYIHLDLLGSPIDGQAGSTSYTENYSPWGEKLDNPIQLSGDVGYTGHQSDVATGLTYMQARYYDPVVGRFMAVDPVGFTPANPMSFNRYAYANDNPFKYLDPNGAEAKSLLQALADNTTFEAGPAFALEGEINLLGPRAKIGLGSLSQTYRVALSGRDEGRYTASGPSLELKYGNAGIGGTSARVTEIFDSDLPLSRSWREEVADSGFITDSNGETRADNNYKLGFSISLPGIKVKFQVDLFKAIFEANEPDRELAGTRLGDEDDVRYKHRYR
jgi:RHS repeat-associated protein